MSSREDEGHIPRGRPTWQRGRAGRFWGGLVDYVRTAWWGLVSPRASESRTLVVVQAVILSDETPPRVLLSIRSDLFGWELPGGTPEPGESPDAALRREVFEETGLEVEIVAHVGDWRREGFRPHVARVYRCRVVHGTPTPSDETPRLAWLDPQDPPHELFPWYREPLALALDPRARPVRRRERQGFRAIARAMWIDLGMRWRGLPPMEIEPAE